MTIARYNSIAMRSLSFLGVAAILSACAAPQPQAVVATPVVPQVVVTPAAPAPVIPEETGPSQARLALLAQYNNLDQDQTLAQLTGLDATDMRTLLGQPDFKRVDEGVEIWQYRGDRCILDLFLYYQNDTWQVTHSDLRGTTLTHTPETDCFSDLILKG